MLASRSCDVMQRQEQRGVQKGSTARPHGESYLRVVCPVLEKFTHKALAEQFP